MGTIVGCVIWGLWAVSDPLALDVCPSWIHGQRTKEAVLLTRSPSTP
jgi:hypothetical protein